MKSWENICTKTKGKRGKDKKGEGKGEEGKKIQVRERFSALTIFHFSETSARRFIRFSSIEPRNTFRHRGDQKNDETISKEKEKKEENMERYIFVNFPIGATCVNEQNIPC